MPSMTRSLALLLAVIALAVLILLFGPAACNKFRSMADQSRIERSQSQAAQNSAADAIGTVSNAGEREAASEDLTRSNEREIRNAPGANDPVNPAARDAGLRALCLRNAYRDQPKCRVFSAPAR